MKGSDSSVISISLPGQTVKEMERAIRDMGYGSRSELVRDSLRDFLREKARIDALKGRVEGTLVILYDHDSNAEVSEVRHRHMKVFRSFMHSDFDGRSASCCEVLIFSGKASLVRNAYYELKALKGIVEAHLYLAGS